MNMISNETSLVSWPCLQSTQTVSTNMSCTLCRISAVIILLISIICFTFNIRFLTYSRCRNSLIVSLFTASILVITISVPGVLIQLFTCRRLCFKIYCNIEGFISYLCGCLCMLIFMILSIHRYLSLCSHPQLLSYHTSTLICWLLSVTLTFPLVFGYINSYLPEGLGFHCSINWKDQSGLSRLYIFVCFIVLYFIPLIIVFYVNVQAHFIIRNVYSRHSLNPSCLYYSYQTSSMKTKRRTNDFEQFYDPKYYIRQASYRKRFRVDYRFLRAVIYLVGTYLIAWTPYSIVAVLQLLNIQFIIQHSLLITLSALMAKSSVILAPLTYLSIMNYSLFKRLLFQ